MFGNRGSMVLSIALLAGVLVAPGCATKKYVRNQVEALQPAIQEAGNASRENAERIDAVDRRAQEGIGAAAEAARAADQRAGQAMTAAQSAQQSAQAAGKSADSAGQGAQQANTRIDTLENRFTRIDNYSVAGTQTVIFAFDSANLSDDAKQTLDRVAAEVSGLNAGYMIELKGFTDSTGRDSYNLALSQRRADSVIRHLTGKNVPLFRISIVGFGEANPVADNETTAGREQNRRVEVTLLRTAVGAGNND